MVKKRDRIVLPQDPDGSVLLLKTLILNIIIFHNIA